MSGSGSYGKSPSLLGKFRSKLGLHESKNKHPSIFDKISLEDLFTRSGEMSRLFSLAAISLKIKQSPPSIQSVLDDLLSRIDLILKSNDLAVLKSHEYFSGFLERYSGFVDSTLGVLRMITGDDIFASEESMRAPEKNLAVARDHLIHDTRIFFHLKSELEYLTPEGKVSHHPTVEDGEAAYFWREHFGSRLIVPWDIFLNALKQPHPLLNDEEGDLLKAAIDICRDNLVSCFEFNVFVQLYLPWPYLLHNWATIQAHPAFLEDATFDEANEILIPCRTRPGSYVFRISYTKLGQWSIGYIDSKGKIKQTLVISLIRALLEGAKNGSYLYPRGTDQTNSLDKIAQLTQRPGPTLAAATMEVSKEQFDLYSRMESSFELCKICDVRQKDVRVKPCNHLLCMECLEKWTARAGGSRGVSCPFCREMIKSHEPIYITPFSDAQPLSDVKQSVIEAKKTMKAISKYQKDQPKGEFAIPTTDHTKEDPVYMNCTSSGSSPPSSNEELPALPGLSPPRNRESSIASSLRRLFKRSSDDKPRKSRPQSPSNLPASSSLEANTVDTSIYLLDAPSSSETPRGSKRRSSLPVRCSVDSVSSSRTSSPKVSTSNLRSSPSSSSDLKRCSPLKESVNEADVAILLEMGFSRDKVEEALGKARNSREVALEALLSASETEA